MDSISSFQEIKKPLKVIIIGAGPAGSFTGYWLKKLAPALDVIIYEEHPHFKKTCSGILTADILDIVDIPKEIIVGHIKHATIYSPNNSLDISFTKPDIIVDREKFNVYMKSLAQKQGCTIITDTKFIGIQQEEKNIFTSILKHQEKTFTVHADILIGADGALSTVAKSAGLSVNPEFYIAIKAKTHCKIDKLLLYPYIKDLAWIFPLQELRHHTCEIGLLRKITPGVKTHQPKIVDLLETVKEQIEKDTNQKLTISTIESALIPEFKKTILHKKIGSSKQAMHVYLVGDSALQVKATTLGGIIAHLKAAKILAQCIINNKNYESNLKKINFELGIHAKSRKIMSNFSDKEWDTLVNDFNDKKLLHTLNTISRDDSKKLFMKLFLKKPSLVKYVRYLWG